MNTIHKFTVPCIGTPFVIETVSGAKPLTAQFQGGQLVFWMHVPLDSEWLDTRRGSVRLKFVAVGTGHDAPDLETSVYVGTAQDPGTGFVWHLFQL